MEQETKVTDSCGCVFCDLDLEPHQVFGQYWHSHYKNHFQPVRCERLSPSQPTEQ